MITSYDSVRILLFPLIPISHCRESCLFHLEGNPAFLIFHTDQLKKKRKEKENDSQANAQNHLKITHCQQSKLCSILAQRQTRDAQTIREGTERLPGQEIPTDKAQHTKLCTEVQNPKECLKTIKVPPTRTRKGQEYDEIRQLTNFWPRDPKPNFIFKVFLRIK